MTKVTKKKTKSQYTILIIVAICALGAVLRFWGIGFGLPGLYHPDEQKIVSTALAFGTGDLNPHFFRYPSFYMYIQFFVYGVYYILGKATGAFTSTYDFAYQFASDPSSIYLIGRSITAIFGVGLIALTFLIGRRLLKNSTAMIAALFVACSLLMVQDSHFVTTDISVAFWITLSTLFAIIYLNNGRMHFLIPAAIFCGLAASTKYNGGLCIITVLLSTFLSPSSGERTLVQRLFGGRMFLAISLSAFGFILGTPYALIDFASFWKGLSFELSHTSFGHLGFAHERIGWWFHFRQSLVHGIGWPIAIIGMGGLLVSIFRPKSPLFLCAPFALLYFLMIGFSNTLFQRYAIPIIPFVALFAAWMLESGNEYLFRSTRVRLTATGIMIFFFILPNFVRIIYHDHLLTKEDTRTLCADWIVKNVPAGSVVVLDAYGPQLLSTDSRALGTYAGRQVKENIKRDIIKRGKSYNVINLSHDGKYDPKWVTDQKPDYIILSSFIVDRVFEHSKKFEVPNRFIEWVRDEFPEKILFSPYKDVDFHPTQFNLKSLMSPSVGDIFVRERPGPVLWLYGPIEI